MRVLLSLLAVGCTEYGVNGAEKPVEPAPDVETAPAIRVEPLALDFGAIPIGAASDAALVTVTNDGDGPLTLDPLSLVEPSAPYTLTALGSTLLEPGGSTSFSVTFAPTLAGGYLAEALVGSDDPVTPEVAVSLAGEGLEGNLTIEPALHDFGTLEHLATDTVTLTLRNTGAADVTVSGLTYTTVGAELVFYPQEAANGALPWVLSPGGSKEVRVAYAPTDDVADEGYITVASDDPDEPQLYATQIGNGRVWEGFSTGWYIVDDSTNYETTSNAARVVETHGDLDGYWYEPSGAHGMIGSADVAGDFAILRDYVVARAGAPTPVTGPLSFYTSSSVPSLTYASYSYVLCEFWLDSTDDPSLYEITTGAVDDGIVIIVNGEILGNAILGSGGSWALTNAVPGAVNSLVVILMDNAQTDKYVQDLAFYRDGVMVTGS
ncbi:MAG: choice-of-anchor D domain-containing protein [Pseudomonadota bacterium]|nr:choice-of-anchor D domain-containing protein [Pseudomonadota bacterium]